MDESALLEKAAHKSALFIGETIIDVYHYVRCLGRPLKEPIVSVEWLGTETFTGGVVAAANHANSFCDKVEIYTDGRRIRKERWVESSHVRKLFECYKETRAKHPAPKGFDGYDVLVVTDYGHGMMTQHLIDKLHNAKNYVAVNVQTNSGNYGYNLATKYKNVDYLCVDEQEARLATQNRYGAIEESLYNLAMIGTKTVITLGKEGAIGFHDGKVYSAPAFTERVVDTLGAGDAFFAVTALIAEDADMQSLLRIGNAAGAIKTGIVGHKRAINKDELLGLLQRN